MSFYEELSKVYDIVFKKNEDTVKFLKKDLNDKAELLDLACGTGTYSIELAKSDYNVLGIDLNNTMIEIAKSKAKGNCAEFYCKDIIDFKDLTKDKRFDRIFCIGNSLVHLENKDVILKVMKDTYKSLKKDGSIVIQTVNYDRILNNNIKHLPTIKRIDEGVEFIRNYNFKENNKIVNFDTELIITDDSGEKTYKNSVPLLPLRSEEIVKILEEAGFLNLELYGDFNETKFTKDSYALVIKGYCRTNI